MASLEKKLTKQFEMIEIASRERGFGITFDIIRSSKEHPDDYKLQECRWILSKLREILTLHEARSRSTSLHKPHLNVLDVGSYRMFTAGLLASELHITSLDCRERISIGNERVLTCDAANIPCSSSNFDLIISTSAIEHFGLGRYGDTANPQADLQATAEMIRLLHPNGHLLLTTTITTGEPLVVFNAHRIYTLKMIHKMLDVPHNLQVLDEVCWDRKRAQLLPCDQAPSDRGVWGVYLGFYRKGPHQQP